MWFRLHQPGRAGSDRPVLFDQDALGDAGPPAPAAAAVQGVAPGAPFAWDGVATPGEIGRPGDLPVPVGQQLRRWGALLALAGLALPDVTAARLGDRSPTEVAVVEASRTGRPDGAAVSGDAGGADRASGADVASGVGAGGDLPSGDAWVTTPAAAAPWEAGVVEADGKPLPTAPPPGPVPVDGIPQPAGTPTTTTTVTRPTAPKGTPAPGETVRAAPKQAVAAPAGPADDLVPADREYLRPILIRYAQENGLPADLVMSLAWVESSWRKNAASDAGAVGVMQLMPNTVEYVSKKLLGLRSNLDPWNPTSNVRMGAKYLRHLLNQNQGNVRQALIAYNQGLTSLRTNGSFSIAERYADRVLALRPQFRSL
ncbi:MAG TPA: lytic transglycosylase domain-containing protein [Acidimicrobiia bacterium]|nr:lytic transglycosylase domain-containing protein [Acidimicrobiia bacterium]